MASEDRVGECPHRAAVSPRDEAARWIRDFLGRPHEELGRDGAVCPFIEPSMRVGSLRIEERPIGPDPTLDRLNALLWQAVDEFTTMEWPHANKTFHTFIVVIPDLDHAKLGLLREMHASARVEIVRRGMMLGYFHPHSRAGSERNSDVEIARAPVPMLAIRNSNFYDILFNHEDPARFRYYVERYGHHYRDGSRKIDPYLVELFEEASKKLKSVS